MTRSAKRLIPGGLLAVGIVTAVGCNKGYTPPPIEPSALVGSWAEEADQSSSRANPRLQAVGEKKYLRHLVINADNTYVLSLRTKSGKETKHRIEGTWAIEEGMLVFKVTNSTFDKNDERNAWAPESSVGLREIEGREVFAVADQEGNIANFKRGD